VADARRPPAFPPLLPVFPDEVEAALFAGFFGDLLLLDFFFEVLFF